MKIVGKLWKDIWSKEPCYEILDLDQLKKNVHIALIHLSAYMNKFEPFLKELEEFNGKTVTIEIKEAVQLG